jgi:TatD DNase family protein
LILVDAHCHLDLYPSYADVVARAVRSGVRVIAVTTTPRSFEGNEKRVGKAAGIYVALGIHPQVIGTAHADLALFASLLPRARVIGEVGLDGSPAHYRTFDQQIETFDNVIALCASSGGRPMSVHSVRAVKQVLQRIIVADARLINRYALHWFTGSPSELRRACDLGCYFSVNIAMLNSAKGISLVSVMPREFVLTETDGPFIESSGEALTPEAVSDSLERLASIWKVTVADASAVVASNFERFMSGP